MVFIYVLQLVCISVLTILLLFTHQLPSVPTTSRQQRETAQKFIQHYKNELFELNEGSWILQSNYDVKQLASKLDIPYKIYTRYDNPPTNFPNFESVLLSLDGEETNSFNGKILMKRNGGQPREYAVKIKITQKIVDIKKNRIVEIVNDICYKYVFSSLNYPPAMRVPEHLIDTMEKTKRDLEFKLFMLTTTLSN